MSGYMVRPRARADLADIWTYTAERWGADQADRYIRLLHGAMLRVAGDPRLWRPCDHIREGYFRYSAGSHILFFARHHAGIVIVRVLHQGMDAGRHL